MSKSQFVRDCQKHFGTNNLYELLHIDPNDGPTISAAKLKKAYYKSSMKWHPDRFNNDDDDIDRHSQTIENATNKFQLISRAYAILSDTNKRQIYDETGIIDDENVIDSDDGDWASKWRKMFKKITKADIDEFTRKYEGSAEERDDIKLAYVKYKGDMDLITSFVITNDEQRIRDIIQSLIDTKEVKSFAKYSNESDAKKTARRRRTAKEAKEAEALMHDIEAKHGTSDLGKIIANNRAKRQAESESFFDQLEAKYAKNSDKKKTTTTKKK